MRKFFLVSVVAVVVSNFGASAFAGLSKSGARLEDEGLSEGFVFLSSMRGNPKFSVSGKPADLKSGDLVPSKGFSAEFEKGENAVLVFSNRSSVYVKGPAKMEIESFKQGAPFKSALEDEREASRSVVWLKVFGGDFYFSGLEPRETSSFKLETLLGTFVVRAVSYRLSCVGDELEISILSGQTTFHPAGEGKSVFIRTGQTALVKKAANGSCEVRLRQMPVTAERKFSEDLAVARFAISTANFTFTEDGKLQVRKLLPTDFFIGRAKYDYRN